ncbi:unnamed protein product, partial [Staurois parvus]
APRHLARQWAPSHQVRQRALSQLARQSEHRIRYRIIWINSGGIESTGPNRIIRLDQFIMLGRGFRPSSWLQAE